MIEVKLSLDKIDYYMYNMFYICLRITTKQKHITGTQKVQRNQSIPLLIITNLQRKAAKEKEKNKRTIKVGRKQENGVSKSFSISKYSKCDELSNQKVELLDGKK